MLITSPQNPKFKLALSLDKKRERLAEKLFLVEGLKENRCALRGGYSPHCFFYPASQDDEGVRNILEDHPGASVFQLTDPLFSKLAVRELAAKVVGIYFEKTRDLSHVTLGANPLILVADGVEKPGNLGAILRTCDAFAVSAVFVTGEGVDLFSPNVIRASLGSIFLRPVLQLTRQEVVEYCRAHHLNLFFAKPDGSTDIKSAKLNSPSALVVGAEDKGVSDEWQRWSFGQNVAIPMLGSIDSLNVAASAAILLYEARRN